jgi:hypothetical protein
MLEQLGKAEQFFAISPIVYPQGHKNIVLCCGGFSCTGTRSSLRRLLSFESRRE